MLQLPADISLHWFICNMRVGGEDIVSFIALDEQEVEKVEMNELEIYLCWQNLL